MSDNKDIVFSESIQNIQQYLNSYSEKNKEIRSKIKNSFYIDPAIQNEMEKFIKDILNIVNCTKLVIIIAKKRYGNHGNTCYMKEGKLKFYYKENLRKTYRAVSRILNDFAMTQNNRLYITESYYHEDNTLILLENAHISKYCDYLYVLADGQIYDAPNLYWFSIPDSRNLKRLLKNGYSYTNPEDYFSNHSLKRLENNKSTLE